MSVSGEVTNYRTYLTNAWTKAADKGATIPANKNLTNLNTAIANLPAGGIQVTNGTLGQYLSNSGTIEAGTFVEFVTSGSTTKVQPATASPFDGITYTRCTTSAAGEVYVL